MTPTDTFIARWQNASGSELANAQSFVGELAELLDQPRPDPAQENTADNAYVFERRVIFRHGDGSSSEGRIDCYKRGCFVLEAKKIKSTANSSVGAGDTPLSAKEKAIYELGLVGVMKSLHQELDTQVCAAYGWTEIPNDEEILTRLVALNAQRQNEEAQGTIRWLRPEFQNPNAQSALLDAADSPPVVPRKAATNAKTASAKLPWPATLPEQLATLAQLLDSGTPQTESQLAARFTTTAKVKPRLPGLLAALAALSRIRRLDDGRWMG